VFELSLAHPKVGEAIFCIVAGKNTVSEIAREMGTRHPTVLEHTRKLEKLGVVTSKKLGRERKYAVNWESLIEIFCEFLLDYDRFTTDSMLRARSPDMIKDGGTLSYAANGQVIPKPLRARRSLALRKASLPRMKRIVETNKLVREFIKNYLESYAKFYWSETDSSLPECVKNFGDRFAILAGESHQIGELLDSKVDNKEQKDFLRFLRFLSDTAITTPNQFACMRAMEVFLTGVGSRKGTGHK
jgi:DNA-binding transcriptional ArsR family regulator